MIIQAITSVFRSPRSILGCLGLMAADLSAEARVFLMAGQSNMSGAGLWKELKESEKKPTAGVQIWHKGQWQDIGPGVSANEGRFGPELSFGREMKEAFPEDDIYLIKTAAGGTSMYKHWKVWDGQGPLLKRFLKTANAALENLEDEGIEYSIEGMIWMQGESDAAQGQGAVYEESLLKFIQAMRKEFDVREMPFVMGRILPTFDKPEGNGPMVRAAQEKVAAEDEKVACFDTDDFPRINKGHYNHEGQLMMGEAFAEHLLELLETTE